MNISATLLAGVPNKNFALYHKMKLSVGDSAAWIQLNHHDLPETIWMVRDIEMELARVANAKLNRNDTITCAANFAPTAGLSADRDTAVAQAVAECLKQHAVSTVTVDRSLPFIFAHFIKQADIDIDYDGDLGVLERRKKTEQEIEYLQKAQSMTEQVMRYTCELIANADANANGELQHNSETLTSEIVRKHISSFLQERNFSNPFDSIVATLPHVAECHHHGTGPLLTGESVVVDIFPRDNETLYWGDCTRTVVHGQPREEMIAMHAAVVDAKEQATKALTINATGDAVHQVTKQTLAKHGYQVLRPTSESVRPDEAIPTMPHGTGHGIGLEVHEPILLDDGASHLVKNEVMTIEPGLYCQNLSGVRVEDMVVATTTGPMNLNNLHTGLTWT
jgi:Xaa-Pro aminopeptidase